MRYPLTVLCFTQQHGFDGIYRQRDPIVVPTFHNYTLIPALFGITRDFEEPHAGSSFSRCLSAKPGRADVGILPLGSIFWNSLVYSSTNNLCQISFIEPTGKSKAIKKAVCVVPSMLASSRYSPGFDPAFRTRRKSPANGVKLLLHTHP